MLAGSPLSVGFVAIALTFNGLALLVESSGPTK